MNQASEFDRLEKYVSKLLEKHEQLLDKHAQLQRRVQQREDEIQELKGKVSSADSERGDMSNRIKGLIDQIEEWEATLGEQESFDEPSSVPGEEEEAHGMDGGDEESDAGEVPEDEGEGMSDEFKTEEDRGKIEDKETAQQNLFSVDPWGKDAGR
jgi:chromosome segregation ATPase